MSNNPILPIVPIVPNGAAPVDDDTADLDEDETTDSQATVEKDVREADAVNDKLDK